MPSPTRAKEVCLVSVRTGETETHEWVIGTFRRAYQIAVFEQRIASPSLSERGALEVMKKMGKVHIWDAKRFEHLEEAMWRPDGTLIIIQKVPVKK